MNAHNHPSSSSARAAATCSPTGCFPSRCKSFSMACAQYALPWRSFLWTKDSNQNTQTHVTLDPAGSCTRWHLHERRAQTPRRPFRETKIRPWNAWANLPHRDQLSAFSSHAPAPLLSTLSPALPTFTFSPRVQEFCAVELHTPRKGNRPRNWLSLTQHLLGIQTRLRLLLHRHLPS